MLRTCLATVASDTTSKAAIAALDRPSAMVEHDPVRLHTFVNHPTRITSTQPQNQSPQR